jgi:hypothetical protein
MVAGSMRRTLALQMKSGYPSPHRSLYAFCPEPVPRQPVWLPHHGMMGLEAVADPHTLHPRIRTRGYVADAGFVSCAVDFSLLSPLWNLMVQCTILPTMDL